MAFTLTEKAISQSKRAAKEPQLAIQIEGVDEVYGAVDLKTYVKIGDEGLKIDGSWKIGGTRNVPNSRPYVSFEGGTSTTITQSLDQQSGRGASVSSIQVALIDKNLELTRLLSPGEVVEDILGTRVKVWLGFQDSGFPDDYVIIFRGQIDEATAGAGIVNLNISHPDQKKRSKLLPKFSTELTSAINDSVETIPVASTSGFQLFGGMEMRDKDNVLVGMGAYTAPFQPYLRIDDEVMAVKNYDDNNFYVMRGSSGGQALNDLTSVASHASGATVESLYRIQGNALDVALGLMLSSNLEKLGTISGPILNGYPYFLMEPYLKDFPIKSVNIIDSSTRVQNTVFFAGVDIGAEYGVVAGDVFTLQSDDSSNNGLHGIIDVVKVPGGSYLLVQTGDEVDLNDEVDSGTTVRFWSYYQSLFPFGLGLKPDEVDIAEHKKLYRMWLSSFDVDIYVKDTIDGKEFIEKELYLPAAAFSIPRKARSSVGYHIGPVPGQKIVTLDSTNVLNAHSLKIKRSTSRNFFNSVIYKYEESLLEEKFKKATLALAEDSRIQNQGNKLFTIESKGMRDDLGAGSLAQIATSRRLAKYKNAAEYIEGIQVNLETGFTMEIGDIILLDMTSLKLSDIKSGTRAGAPRLFEVEDIRKDIRTGVHTMRIIDTGFDPTARYGLISPASKIKSGIDQRSFVIKQTGNSGFGNSEFRKWTDHIGANIRVRNSDYSITGTARLLSVTANTIALDQDLGFVPQADYWMSLAPYDDQPDKIKLLYTFMTNDETFEDGTSPYLMI